MAVDWRFKLIRTGWGNVQGIAFTPGQVAYTNNFALGVQVTANDKPIRLSSVTINAYNDGSYIVSPSFRVIVLAGAVPDDLDKVMHWDDVSSHEYQPRYGSTAQLLPVLFDNVAVPILAAQMPYLVLGESNFAFDFGNDGPRVEANETISVLLAPITNMQIATPSTRIILSLSAYGGEYVPLHDSATPESARSIPRGALGWE